MDFVLLNVYEDAAGRGMGSRFLHARTGFLVDLLEIQSVPQGFFWVKTLARTERGEAHACEHLLLGKGAKGRAVAALEEMTLSASSAWTGQLSTAYHFNTLAGEEGFLRNLEARLDALLHPDFSDEEIRREVAHVAVARDPATGRLGLEEKGTVFTEMMSSSEGPSYPLWTGISELLYGAGHVQANNAGGRPEAMRALNPADLRAFHAEFYHPAGMGLIASLPAALPAERVLVHLDAVLARLWPGGDRSEAPGIQTHRLPPPAPAARPGALEIRPYASESAASPGQAVFAWPARLDLDPDEIALAELFLDSIAGGPGTPLYAALIASRTRVLKTGASAVFGYHSDEPGHPLMIGLAGLDPDALDRERLAAIRRAIGDTLRRRACLARWRPRPRRLQPRGGQPSCRSAQGGARGPGSSADVRLSARACGLLAQRARPARARAWRAQVARARGSLPAPGRCRRRGAESLAGGHRTLGTPGSACRPCGAAGPRAACGQGRRAGGPPCRLRRRALRPSWRPGSG